MAEKAETMDNRRKEYRHRLLPPVKLLVQLICGPRPQPTAGVAANLSVGGMAVLLSRGAPVLAEGDRCAAKVVIPDSQVELNLPAVVVHQSGAGDMPLYGLQFLAHVDLAEEEKRERVIGRFLLEEQRRLRRLNREPEKYAG